MATGDMGSDNRTAVINTDKVNTLEWRPAGERPEALLLINQLLLPQQFEMVECLDYRQVGHAIKTMQVRGAPAIGVTAA